MSDENVFRKGVCGLFLLVLFRSGGDRVFCLRWESMVRVYFFFVVRMLL